MGSQTLPLGPVHRPELDIMTMDTVLLMEGEHLHLIRSELGTEDQGSAGNGDRVNLVPDTVIPQIPDPQREGGPIF